LPLFFFLVIARAGEYELCKAEEEALGFDPDVSSVLPAFDSFSLEEALKIAGLDQPKVRTFLFFTLRSTSNLALFQCHIRARAPPFSQKRHQTRV
jgi:hypothetical protein